MVSSSCIGSNRRLGTPAKALQSQADPLASGLRQPFRNGLPRSRQREQRPPPDKGSRGSGLRRKTEQTPSLLLRWLSEIALPGGWCPNAAGPIREDDLIIPKGTEAGILARILRRPEIAALTSLQAW